MRCWRAVQTASTKCAGVWVTAPTCRRQRFSAGNAEPSAGAHLIQPATTSSGPTGHLLHNSAWSSGFAFACRTSCLIGPSGEGFLPHPALTGHLRPQFTIGFCLRCSLGTSLCSLDLQPPVSRTAGGGFRSLTGEGFTPHPARFAGHLPLKGKAFGTGGG